MGFLDNLASGAGGGNPLVGLGLGLAGSLFHRGNGDAERLMRLRQQYLQKQGGIGDQFNDLGLSNLGDYNTYAPMDRQAILDYARDLSQDPYTSQRDTADLNRATAGTANDYLAAKANLQAGLADRGLGGIGDSSIGAGAATALEMGRANQIGQARNDLAYRKIQDRERRKQQLVDLMNGAMGGSYGRATGALGQANNIYGDVGGQYGGLSQLSNQQTAGYNQGIDGLFGGLANMFGGAGAGGGQQGGGGAGVWDAGDGGPIVDENGQPTSTVDTTPTTNPDPIGSVFLPGETPPPVPGTGTIDVLNNNLFGTAPVQQGGGDFGGPLATTAPVRNPGLNGLGGSQTSGPPVGMGGGIAPAPIHHFTGGTGLENIGGTPGTTAGGFGGPHLGTVPPVGSAGGFAGPHGGAIPGPSLYKGLPPGAGPIPNARPGDPFSRMMPLPNYRPGTARMQPLNGKFMGAGNRQGALDNLRRFVDSSRDYDPQENGGAIPLGGFDFQRAKEYRRRSKFGNLGLPGKGY